MGTQIETMQEHEGIELFHQMCGKFGWVGCIFTEDDIRQQLEQEEVSEEDMATMVEKVQWTRWWRKVMDEAMVETGYEILAEAIAEATTGEGQ